MKWNIIIIAIIVALLIVSLLLFFLFGEIFIFPLFCVFPLSCGARNQTSQEQHDENRFQSTKKEDINGKEKNVSIKRPYFYCPNCGKLIKEPNLKFCPNCGMKLPKIKE